MHTEFIRIFKKPPWAEKLNKELKNWDTEKL